MMWIFDRRVAELRKKYHIIVGVLYDHEESTLARRKAKILKTDCPITFPLDPFQEALVEIEYTDHKSRLKRKFVRPANLNPESRSSAKAPLVVTSGEHKGKLAHNMRTNGAVVTVRVEGIKGGVTLSQSILCKLELATM